MTLSVVVEFNFSSTTTSAAVVEVVFSAKQAALIKY